MFGALVASDVDAQSVAVAERGEYAQTAMAGVPAAWIPRWFALSAERAIAQPKLRQQVQFAVHDLAGPQLVPAQAVVAHFDLIVCCNVLIYLQPRLRALCLRRFVGMLPVGGALILGAAETVAGPDAKWFEPQPGAPAKLHIYRRIRGMP